MRPGAFILDFDGPVTHLFEHVPVETAREGLRRIVSKHGFDAEPFESLGMISTLRYAEANFYPRQLLADMETFLSAFEVEAARTSPFAPGARELLTKLQAAQIPVAIVTNNSPLAAAVFFEVNALTPLPVFGRQLFEYSFLKPDPTRLNQALLLLSSSLEETFMVGDQVSDVKAANAAGILSLGYAKTETRAGELKAAGAYSVHYSMDTIL